MDCVSLSVRSIDYSFNKIPTIFKLQAATSKSTLNIPPLDIFFSTGILFLIALNFSLLCYIQLNHISILLFLQLFIFGYLSFFFIFYSLYRVLMHSRWETLGRLWWVGIFQSVRKSLLLRHRPSFNLHSSFILKVQDIVPSLAHEFYILLSREVWNFPSSCTAILFSFPWSQFLLKRFSTLFMIQSSVLSNGSSSALACHIPV